MNTLITAFTGLYPADSNFERDVRKAGLPPLTLMEAMVFAVGDIAFIEALLKTKPHLRVVEQFINDYSFA